MNKTVDIKAALQFGWDTLRNNFAFFLKLLIVLFAAMLVPALIVGKISIIMGSVFAVPLQFLVFVWQMILSMGILKISLKLYDQQAVEISDLWSMVNRTLDFVIVRVAVILLVSFGLILFIVPGLIWLVQFYPAGYLVVDRGTGAIAALKAGSQISKGVKLPLILFVFTLALLNLLGALFMGIGLMITMPVSILASTYVYRQLLAATEAVGQSVQK